MYAVVPERYFIWSDAGKDSGFTWALYPVDARHTRLVSRIRWSHHWSQPSQIAPDLFTEFTDHLAVRKILQGVQGRVEGSVEPTAWTNTELAIYVAAAFTFAVAVILNAVHRFSPARWLAGLAAGAVWLVTWYAPVPMWAGPLLLVFAIYGLWRTRSTVWRGGPGRLLP